MRTSIRNVNYIILLCTDIEEMKRFYTEVMGFRVYRDWGDWFEMQVGSALLTLRERGRPYDGPATPGAAGVQLAFRVTPSAVDACYEELLQQKVLILEPPRTQDYGHRTLFFKDPENNILEIYADL